MIRLQKYKKFPVKLLIPPPSLSEEIKYIANLK